MKIRNVLLCLLGLWLLSSAVAIPPAQAQDPMAKAGWVFMNGEWVNTNLQGEPYNNESFNNWWENRTRDAVNVNIVAVNATAFPEIHFFVQVTDDNGNPILGLDESNFTVEENTLFCNEDVTGIAGGGTSFGLAMDCSGSMTGQGPLVISAGNLFVNMMNPLDQAAVVFFSTTAYVQQPMTNNHTLLLDAISHYYTSGMTYFWGGIALALQQTQAEPPPRAVVAFTDGYPTQSGTWNQTNTIALAQSIGAPVYAIGVGSSVDIAMLTNLANATGGFFYRCTSAAGLDSIYALILGSYINQYEVAYITPNPALDGTWRNIHCTANYLGNSDWDSTGYRAPYMNYNAPRITLTPSTLNFMANPQLAGIPLTITAWIVDDDTLQSTTLSRRLTGTTYYAEYAMTHVSDSLYAYTVPGSAVQTPGMDFYLSATDSYANTTTSPLTNPGLYPHQIAVLPNVAPLIIHTPISVWSDGDPMPVSCEVIDNTQFVDHVSVFYKAHVGGFFWIELPMSHGAGNTWAATIPGDALVDSLDLDYKIMAWDNFGTASEHGPHFVDVGGLQQPNLWLTLDSPWSPWPYVIVGDTIQILLNMDTKGHDIGAVSSYLNFEEGMPLISIVDANPALPNTQPGTLIPAWMNGTVMVNRMSPLNPIGTDWVEGLLFGQSVNGEGELMYMTLVAQDTGDVTINFELAYPWRLTSLLNTANGDTITPSTLGITFHIYQSLVHGYCYLEQRFDPPNPHHQMDVTFELRDPPGYVIWSDTLWTAPDGHFVLFDLPITPPGSYDWLTTKTPMHLRGVSSPLMFPVPCYDPIYIAWTSSTAVTDTMLHGGDANDDDWVFLQDFGLLSNAWLSVIGDPNWNWACDFDCDSAVADSDLNILNGNFAEVGVYHDSLPPWPLDAAHTFATGSAPSFRLDNAAANGRTNATINVEKIPALRGYAAIINYDPTQVEPLPELIANGSLFSATENARPALIARDLGGAVVVSGYFLGGGTTAMTSGSLAEVPFRSLIGNPSAGSVVLSALYLADESDQYYTLMGSGMTPSVLAAGALPTEFKLHPAAPNPFNAQVHIRFDLPEAAQVSLVIYDLMGRQVAQLVQGRRDAGFHTVTWDAQQFASGVYVYRLQAGSYSAAYKMVLMK